MALSWTAEHVVGRPQHIAGRTHVVGGARAQRLLDAGAAHPQVVQLSGVRVVTVGDRLGEDGRIGGHPTTRSWATRWARLPLVSRRRLRSSSQTETPLLFRSSSGLVIVVILTCWAMPPSWPVSADGDAAVTGPRVEDRT